MRGSRVAPRAPDRPWLPGPGRSRLRRRASIGDWFDENRRDLPWRATDRTPWGVLVSEVMLQQTPVVRVVPAWTAWMARWPQPADLAGEAPGEAVRQWDRLGYPRRALNLHAASVAIVERHAGWSPTRSSDLRALPGVGEYTAAAVRAFAFGRRSVVLDTNVRRVLARLVDGQEHPPPSLTVGERARADALVPADDAAAAHWSAAVMELGALVCTANSPRCQACPVVADVRLGAGRAAGIRRAGAPGPAGSRGPTGRSAVGSWRFCGSLRARRALRDRGGLGGSIQRERALDGLVADGLVELVGDDRFGLPSRTPSPT